MKYEVVFGESPLATVVNPLPVLFRILYCVMGTPGWVQS